MARKPSGPWFWEARGSYYCTINGKRIPLNTTDLEEATTKWHVLAAKAAIDTQGEDLPFATLAEAFLTHCQENHSDKTYKVYKYFLQCAFDRLKELKPNHTFTVSTLKPFHLYEVIRLQNKRAAEGATVVNLLPNGKRERALKPWSQSAKGSFLRCIQSCFNWAVKQDLIPSNPLHNKLEIPAIVSRGREADVSPELYEKVLEVAPPCFRDFLIAVKQSGTRPHMVASLTATHFSEQNRCWIFEDHKTDKSGEPLVVYLSDYLIKLTKQQIAKYPSGPLFRNSRGNAWKDSTWGKAMNGVRKRLKKKGIETNLITYWFRHTFATDHLAAKVPETFVAALLGHKSTAMLQKHYGHLTNRADAIKSALQVKTTEAEARVLGEQSPEAQKPL